MNNQAINWNKVPNIITKDQLYKLCKISKSTARYLLMSGKIPCEYSGKKTRCYKIHKTDVKRYLKEREIYPDKYSLPGGLRKRRQTERIPKVLPPIILEDMHDYYSDLLKDCRDVLTAIEVETLIGYQRRAILNWCARGHLKYFIKSNKYHIPKIFLIDFLCSIPCRGIVIKTDWHINALINYRNWINVHKSQND